MLDDPNGKMATFYNDPLVQKALHVEDGSFWIECMPGAGRRRNRRRHLQNQRRNVEELLPGQILLAHDQPISVVPYVADLLDGAKIDVLIYNGDLDMTTNSQGSEYLLDHMKWNGASGWSNTSLYQRGIWLPRYDDNTTFGGYMKEYQNLHFLTVFGSGHLVPFNRPKIAYEIILRFLGNESLIDKVLPSYNIRKTVDDNAIPTKVIDHVTKKLKKDAKVHVSNHVISWSSIILIASIGFLMGYFVSRITSKANPSRQGYEIINSATIK